MLLCCRQYVPDTGWPLAMEWRMESFPGAAGYAAGEPGSKMRVERVGFRQWNGVASPSAGPAAADTTITMPLGLGLAMEMENGEDVRGSLPTHLLVRAAQPCIGVVFGD